MPYKKRFQEWISLKEKLDSKNHKPPYVSEGDIWWVSIGENIGYEICGKSHSFSRPVLIYKKLSRNFFLIIPLTTKNKTGEWFINFKQEKTNIIACLSQIRTIDVRRFSTKIGQVDSNDFYKISKSFNKLYSTNFPHQINGGAAGKSRK